MGVHILPFRCGLSYPLHVNKPTYAARSRLHKRRGGVRATSVTDTMIEILCRQIKSDAIYRGRSHIKRSLAKCLPFYAFYRISFQFQCSYLPRTKKLSSVEPKPRVSREYKHFAPCFVSLVFTSPPSEKGGATEAIEISGY